MVCFGFGKRVDCSVVQLSKWHPVLRPGAAGIGYKCSLYAIGKESFKLFQGRDLQ
jgi:hypothetical protein